MTDRHLLPVKGDLVTRILRYAVCAPFSGLLAYGGFLAPAVFSPSLVYAQENPKSQARTILQSPEKLSSHLRTLLYSEGIKYPVTYNLGDESCKKADTRAYKEIGDLLSKVKNDLDFMKGLVEKFNRESTVYVSEGLGIVGSSAVGKIAVELMPYDEEYFEKIVEQYMSTPFKDSDLAKDCFVVGAALIRISDLEWTSNVLFKSLDRICSQTLQIERIGYVNNIPNGADIIVPLINTKGKTLYNMDREELDKRLAQLTQKLCDYNPIDSYSFIYRDVERTVLALIGITKNIELVKEVQDKTSGESGDYQINKVANERAKELGLR